MSHWVVGRARIAGSGEIWIWGKVGTGAGFDDVFYTAPDGWSPVGDPGRPNVDEILFVVPIAEPEVASKRDTFPSSSAPPARTDVIGAMGIPAGDAD